MGSEVVITVEGLLWICGVIITVGGATAIITKWLAPLRALKKDVDNKINREEFDGLKKEVELVKKYQITDHKELQKVEVGIEKICKCTLAITDHELTGNSIDKLREAKDEMQDYLIQK